MLLTNWVHLIGIYFGFYLSNIIMKAIGLNEYTWKDILLLSLITIPLLIYIYGLKLLVAFYSVIVVLNLIFFASNTNRVRQKLLFEWGLIIPIFVYWAFENDYWHWLILCLIFLLTQLFREKKILQLTTV